MILLKANGAIGAFFGKEIKDYIGWTIDTRSIYDLVYNFVIIILITQIIAGLYSHKDLKNNKTKEL